MKWFNFEDQQLYHATYPLMQHTTTTETSMQVIHQKGRQAPRALFPEKLLVSFSAITISSRASPVLRGGDTPSSASAVAATANASPGPGSPVVCINISGVPVNLRIRLSAVPVCGNAWGQGQLAKFTNGRHDPRSYSTNLKEPKNLCRRQ